MITSISTNYEGTLDDFGSSLEIVKLVLLMSSQPPRHHGTTDIKLDDKLATQLQYPGEVQNILAPLRNAYILDFRLI
jgi:hypothetical protein